MKIYEKDVKKYGETPGCRACTEILVGRDRGKSATTYLVPHNADCRARMTELMRNDEDDKHRVARTEHRQQRHAEEKDSASNKPEVVCEDANREVKKDGV